jgi:hypothetical protein
MVSFCFFRKITILFEDWTLRAEEAHKSYVFSEKVIFLGAESRAQIS